MSVILTADGACNPNPGFGGWATIVRYGNMRRVLYGFKPNTTNNRMELTAIIEGLRFLTQPSKVLVRTDSRTALSWCRPDSFKTEKKRQKHPLVWPLIQEFRAVAAMHEVSFEWVRGHAGDPDNEECDYIAERLAFHRGNFRLEGHEATNQTSSVL